MAGFLGCVADGPARNLGQRHSAPVVGLHRRRQEVDEELVVGPGVAQLGMAFSSLPPDGARIWQLLPNSWAERTGIGVGDEVRSLNGAGIRGMSVDEFREALRQRPLRIRLLRARPRSSEVAPDVPATAASDFLLAAGSPRAAPGGAGAAEPRAPSASSSGSACRSAMRSEAGGPEQPCHATASGLKKVRFREDRADGRCDIVCPICEEVMYRPVRTICGHCFCLACLMAWLREAPQRSCPLCRAVLGGPAEDSWRGCGGRRRSSGSASRSASGRHSSSSSSAVACEDADAEDGVERTLSAFSVDGDMERRAVAALGAEAYYERELDVIDPKAGRKLRAKLQALRRLSDGADIAMAGVGIGAITGAATAWGASTAAYMGTFLTAQAALAGGGLGFLVGAHSVASAAFWSTALSAEVASDALFAGAVAGAGASAFFAGMRIAAWLDAQNRYCILQSDLAMSEPKSSISILNLLDTVIHVRVFSARRQPCAKQQQSGIDAVVDFVAVRSGLRHEDRDGKYSWRLEPCGEPIVEGAVLAKREAKLELPPKRGHARLLLTVSLAGVLISREVGMCRARRGQRYVIGEIDSSSASMLRRSSACCHPAVADDPQRPQEAVVEDGMLDSSMDQAPHLEEGRSSVFDLVVRHLLGSEEAGAGVASIGTASDGDSDDGAAAAGRQGSEAPTVWRRRRWEDSRGSGAGAGVRVTSSLPGGVEQPRAESMLAPEAVASLPDAGAPHADACAARAAA